MKKEITVKIIIEEDDSNENLPFGPSVTEVWVDGTRIEREENSYVTRDEEAYTLFVDEANLFFIGLVVSQG